MKTLSTILVVLHGVHALAAATGRSLRAPLSTLDLHKGDKLIPAVAKKQWAHNKHRQRMHMFARESPLSSEDEEPVEGCIACFGVQVVYGKYASEDGDQSDNSYYVFKDPKRKSTDEPLPIIVHFHPGGFFAGSPWKKETSEITSYLKRGFAVVSVGYRLVTEKYFYEAEDGANKTEELIHVDDDGVLLLDNKGRTMDDYKVRVGKQEFITKYLYDATQAMEHLIENAEKFGLDVHRIVFVGESTGGAAMQYLTWVYHKFNVGRFTPKGMIYHNAQLNYPVNNMLDGTWNLFVETMGPKVKLSDVVSPEACPTIIGNHMCGSPLGEASDYELCNHVWNKKALKRFCGEAYETATLADVKKHQRWPKEDKEVGAGMEKLWYNSENMQKHLPHDPFYIYVANSMNGTGAVDAAHHSIFALNFAKFAEMNTQGGIQYTVYYTDFEHMTEADRGTQRLEVSTPPGDLGHATGLAMPAAALATTPLAGGPGTGPSPGPGPMPAPAPAPAPAVAAGSTVFNYLSTHGWREDFGGRDVEPASAEERILYACLAAKVGPFEEFSVKPNKTREETKESAAYQGSVSTFSFALIALIAMMRTSY